MIKGTKDGNSVGNWRWNYKMEPVVTISVRLNVMTPELAVDE